MTWLLDRWKPVETTDHGTTILRHNIGILGIVRTRHQPLWVTFFNALAVPGTRWGPDELSLGDFGPQGPFWAPFAFEDDPFGVRDLSFCLPPNPHFYVISIDSLSKLRKRKEKTHHSTHPKVRCLTYWFKKNVMIIFFNYYISVFYIWINTSDFAIKKNIKKTWCIPHD